MLGVLAGLGALLCAGSAAAVPAPVPQFLTPAASPASASTWTFTWGAVAPTGGGTIDYEYCVVASAATACPPASPTTALTTASVTVTDGLWVFKVRATETGGVPVPPNPSLYGTLTFTADTVALPPTVISGPAPGALLNAAPTYGLAGEPGATFAWRFEPTVGAPVLGAGATATFGVPVNPNEPITWQLVATQTDAVGNTSADSVPRVFTIDRVRPGGATFTPPSFGGAGNLTNAPPVITLGGGGEPVTYQWSIDGGPTQTGPALSAATVNLATLLDGAHTLQAWTVDAAGNQSLGPHNTLGFVIDRVAPALPVITGTLPDAAYTATVPGYTLGGSEPGADYLWSLQGPVSLPEVLGTTVNLGALALDGLYTVRARTRDAAGNLSGIVTRTFNLDRVAPGAPIITPDILDITNTPPDVALSGGGEPVTYRWRLNGGGAQVGASADLTGLADGQHVFEAWSVDRAGNESARTVRVFVLDRKAPDPPTITEPPAATNRVPRPVITGPAKTTIFWTLTGPKSIADNVPTPAAPVFGTLPDGEYVLQAYARTSAGNRSGTVKVAFTLDTEAPAPPVLLSGPTSPRGGSRPQFTWTGEPGAVFVWQIMREDLIIQGPARTVSSGARASTLATGRYTFRLSQVDAAGNASEQSAPWAFEIQAKAPPSAGVAGLLGRKRVLVKSYGPLTPRAGRVVAFSQRTELRWTYRSGRPARAFNLQVFDEEGRKILSQFPKKSQFTVPRRILRTGKRYYWQVWAYWGPQLGYARRPLGVSYFDVRPTPAQVRAAQRAGGNR